MITEVTVVHPKVGPVSFGLLDIGDFFIAVENVLRIKTASDIGRQVGKWDDVSRLGAWVSVTPVKKVRITYEV